MCWWVRVGVSGMAASESGYEGHGDASTRSTCIFDGRRGHRRTARQGHRRTIEKDLAKGEEVKRLSIFGWLR